MRRCVNPHVGAQSGKLIKLGHQREECSEPITRPGFPEGRLA